MTFERFQALAEVTGKIWPDGLENYVSDLENDSDEVLPRERLQYVMDLNHVPCDKQERLLDALDQANRIPELVEMAHIMAKDAVRALNRNTAHEFTQPKPACLEGFAKDAFGFLLSQLMVLEGRKQLRARGIPEKYDLDIPERMTRRAMGKYVATGDINFDDFPWDVNFFCCDIFLLDRFYFIPYMWQDAPEAWRNVETGEVTALWKGGVRVRRDGQLDGVNHVTDPDAFVTVYEETDESVKGNYTDPEGYIRDTVLTLDKKKWKKVLKNVGNTGCYSDSRFLIRLNGSDVPDVRVYDTGISGRALGPGQQTEIVLTVDTEGLTPGEYDINIGLRLDRTGYPVSFGIEGRISDGFYEGRMIYVHPGSNV